MRLTLPYVLGVQESPAKKSSPAGCRGRRHSRGHARAIHAGSNPRLVVSTTDRGQRPDRAPEHENTTAFQRRIPVFSGARLPMWRSNSSTCRRLNGSGMSASESPFRAKKCSTLGRTPCTTSKRTQSITSSDSGRRRPAPYTPCTHTGPVSEEPATVVMPTGTGKTDTMPGGISVGAVRPCAGGCTDGRAPDAVG